MDIEQLIRRHPKLYHMSEEGSWLSIQQHGLLSTSALLDLYEKKGQERAAIESQVRTTNIPIQHPKYGKAVIRDQAPLCDKPEKGIYLEQCLVGVTIQEYCKFLNRKSFFWAQIKPLNWMLKAYRFKAQWVIVVNTASLLSRHADKISLSHMNSGSILNGQKRGIDIFKSISDYNYLKVWELAVEYSMPDIVEFTISIEEWRGNKKIRNIWPE